MLHVTHLGGPTVLLQLGGWRILTDPTFDAPGTTYAFGWGTGSTKTAGPALAPEARRARRCRAAQPRPPRGQPRRARPRAPSSCRDRAHDARSGPTTTRRECGRPRPWRHAHAARAGQGDPDHPGHPVPTRAPVQHGRRRRCHRLRGDAGRLRHGDRVDDRRHRPAPTGPPVGRAAGRRRAARPSGPGPVPHSRVGCATRWTARDALRLVELLQTPGRRAGALRGLVALQRVHPALRSTLAGDPAIAPSITWLEPGVATPVDYHADAGARTTVTWCP